MQSAAKARPLEVIRQFTKVCLGYHMCISGFRVEEKGRYERSDLNAGVVQVLSEQQVRVVCNSV